MTLVLREAFVKYSYFSNNLTDPERHMFSNAFSSTILLNIRTYDHNSMIMYVNDHLNNFIHIYVSDGRTITFLFNFGNEIKNLTVECAG